MNNDIIKAVLGAGLILFCLFLFIIHRIRRRELPDEFNWKMDYGGVDGIGALVWFFKKVRERRKKKKEKNEKM